MGNLSCELDTPLLSLQEQVLDLCRSRLPDVYKKRVQMHCGTVEVPEAVEQGSAGDYSAYGVEIPSSIENFVMRELRDDVDAMPGRCLWVRGGPLVAVAELETPVMPTVAVSSKKAVPVKRGGGKKASFSSGLVAVSAACAAPSAITKSTIRRSKLSSGSRCLIVQLLPAGIAHSASIGSDGAMRLWVFRGTPAASSRLYFGRPIDGAARDKLHCPEGDPVEVNLSGGPVPTLPQLKRAIERDLLVPFHSQRVFKLFHTDHVWRDLDAIGAKRKTVKGSDSLLAVPYSLKDGDMLCVIDCGATSGQTPVAFGAHVETKAAVEFIVDRPVDEMRRQHASSGGVDKGKKKKQSRQEIGLRLAGDFDFSDDEDGIES